VNDFVGSLASQGGQTRQQVEKEFFEKARPTSLLKRFATPDEVAAMVTFVCSPLSAATNGALYALTAASSAHRFRISAVASAVLQRKSEL